MQQLASQNAPSPGVVVPHFIFGAVVWLCVTILIIFFPGAFVQHYFNPRLLSITHLLALGWITMIIFGALYQLVPVILEIKLFSEKLSVTSFVSLAIGCILISVSFWKFQFSGMMHAGATFAVIAVSLFAVNIFATARNSAKKTIERKFILTSVVWLVFTVSAGMTLAINLSSPFLEVSHLELLKLHAHAGIVGWFMQLIIGVSSKLIPMFIVSHHLNENKLRISYYLINIGLLSFIISLFLEYTPGVLFGVILVVAGISFFLSFVYEAYKKRVKRNLDLGMKQSMIAFLMLLIPVLLSLVFVSELWDTGKLTIPLAVAYGSTIFIGFITSLIMGQTYKTLPFIIWLKVYRDKVGKGKLPFPKDLYSEKLADFQLWTFIPGFATLIVGIILLNKIIVTISGILLLISVSIYFFNLMKIILHKPITLHE